MTDEEPTVEHSLEPQQPHRVRLPGFLIEEEIGLGDAIKRVTYSMGIKPCGGCEKRAGRSTGGLHIHVLTVAALCAGKARRRSQGHSTP